MRLSGRSVLTILALLGASSCVAQAEPIGPLHCNDSTGVTRAMLRSVTIVGTVSAQFSTEKSARFYVQDSTGGVCVFGPTKNCAAVGDSVRVSGDVASFSGLTEITGSAESPLAIEALGKSRAPVVALALSPARIQATLQPDGCEPNEGRLVLLHNVLIRAASGGLVAAGGKFTEGTNYRLMHAGGDSTTNWAMMRIASATGCEGSRSLAGAPIPATAVQIVGVLTQYMGRGSTSGGYQLLPRTPADLQPPTRDEVPPHRRDTEH